MLRPIGGAQSLHRGVLVTQWEIRGFGARVLADFFCLLFGLHIFTQLCTERVHAGCVGSVFSSATTMFNLDAPIQMHFLRCTFVNTSITHPRKQQPHKCTQLSPPAQVHKPQCTRAHLHTARCTDSPPICVVHPPKCINCSVPIANPDLCTQHSGQCCTVRHPPKCINLSAPKPRPMQHPGDCCTHGTPTQVHQPRRCDQTLCVKLRRTHAQRDPKRLVASPAQRTGSDGSVRCAARERLVSDRK